MATTEKKKQVQTVEPVVQEPVTTTTPVQPAQQTASAPNNNTTTTNSDVPKVQTSGGANTSNAQNDTAGLLTMSGLSDGTKQTLGSLISNGYQPSETVNSALAELNSVISNQPAAFQSAYMQQLNNVMNSILGRQSFSYDMASDPMYQQMRSQYVQAGKNAMQDTMGQAAMLTGGYGNSYAQTAGQQSYDAYLQQLGDKMPELYGMALDAYNAEGDRLATNYGLLSDAYSREYGEYQDDYNRWLNERDYAADRYYDERNFDYGQYGDVLNTQLDNRDYYYGMVMDMINMGQTPSDDLLRMAGFSDEDLAKLNGSQNKSSGSSGSKKSSSGAGNKKNDVAAPETVNAVENAAASSFEQLLEEAKKKKIVTPKNLYITDYLGMR